MITPDKKEVLRYLGLRGAKPCEETEALLQKAGEDLGRAVVPRTLSRRLQCEVNNAGVSFGGYFFESEKLAAHLRGCEEVFLMAATLGIGADNLLRRVSVTDMAKAAVMQATAAAMVESVCDGLCLALEKETAKENLFLKPRFSPGYGDFNIKYQREIFELLDCRRIGLTLTGSFIMIPTKSVTAVIGITRDRQCNIKKCSLCPNTDCEFREEQL